MALVAPGSFDLMASKSRSMNEGLRPNRKTRKRMPSTQRRNVGDWMVWRRRSWIGETNPSEKLYSCRTSWRFQTRLTSAFFNNNNKKKARYFKMGSAINEEPHMDSNLPCHDLREIASIRKSWHSESTPPSRPVSENTKFRIKGRWHS